MALTSKKNTKTNTVELEITVDADTFEQAVQQSYRKNAKRINLPGFRKGKAPRKMIEKVYGKEIFYDDATEIVYPKAYSDAVEEAGIEPVDRADVEIVQIGDDGLIFKAVVTIRPDVTLGAYQGLTAEKPEIKASEEEVMNELKRLQAQQAQLVSVDRPAQEGDVVVLDYEGFVDGKPFAGGKDENHQLKLGSQSFIPGFEEQLIGSKAGEERAVEVTFPADYHAAELAGKKATFQCKVHEVQENRVDELDDEFAKDVSEFETLAELKADILDKMQKRKDDEAQSVWEQNLMEKLLESFEAEIPEVMFESELDDIAQDFDLRMRYQGLNLEQYLQFTGSDLKAFRDSFKDQAIKRVKTRLALEKVAALEKIEIAAEEMEQEYQRLADQYNTELSKVKAAISAASLKKDMAVGKAADLIKATGKEEKPKAEKKTTVKKADATEEKPAKKPAAKKAEEAGEKPAKKPAAKKTAEKKAEESKA